MDRNFYNVMDEVMSLDRESQILIAERIVNDAAVSFEHESAWRAEVRRRLSETRAGSVSMRDVRDVIHDARNRIKPR